MAGTSDNIIDLLELIEKQGLNYVLTIIEPKKLDKNQDQVTIYTSLEKNSVNKLISFLKKTQKEKKIDDK
jgi:hypothetical protein